MSLSLGQTKKVIEYVSPPDSMRRQILVRPKILMGSGPTNLSQRVTEAMSKPIMGIYHKETFQVHENCTQFPMMSGRKSTFSALSVDENRSTRA